MAKIAPRPAGHTSPRVSTTPEGATAHSVDGDTTKLRHSTTHATATYCAAHNVDSSFSHRPPSELRASGTQKTTQEDKNRRQTV